MSWKVFIHDVAFGTSCVVAVECGKSFSAGLLIAWLGLAAVAGLMTARWDIRANR